MRVEDTDSSNGERTNPIESGVPPIRADVEPQLGDQLTVSDTKATLQHKGNDHLGEDSRTILSSLGGAGDTSPVSTPMSALTCPPFSLERQQEEKFSPRAISIDDDPDR